MLTFIAVCLAVLVLEMGFLVAVLVLAWLQIQRTARAVEILTYRLDSQVAAIGDTVRSGWGSLFGNAMSLASRLFGKRS